MTCHACGTPRHSDGKYCGQCGAELVGSSVDVPLDREQDEAADDTPLARLSTALRGVKSIPPACVQAVCTIASERIDTGHSTLVLGEHGRESAVLINQLLGETVLTESPRMLVQTTRVQWGSVRNSHDKAGDKRPAVFQRPITLLRHTAIVTGPELNSIEDDAEWMLTEMVRADVVIVCLSAGQLLAESEMAMLREHLVPMTNAPVALAVMGLSRVESRDERQELRGRVLAFVKTLRIARVHTAFVDDPDETGSDLDTLRAWIIHHASQGEAERERSHALQIEHLLGHIEGLLGKEDDMSHEAAFSPCVDVLSILWHEHDLALTEAVSHLRMGISHIREDLPKRFDALYGAQIQHDGLTHLARQVLNIAQEAASIYIENVQRYLLGDESGSLRAIAGRMSLEEAGQSVTLPSVPMIGTPLPTPGVRTVAVAGAGVLMLTLGKRMWTRVAGTVAVLGAAQLRRMRHREIEQMTRECAVQASLAWLASAEPQLVESLRTEAMDVYKQLRDAVNQYQVSAFETPTPSQVELARQALAECITNIQTGGIES